MHRNSGLMTLARTLVVMPVLIVFSSAAFADNDNEAYEAAIAGMAENPQAAEKAVKSRSDGVGLLDRILFLYAFKDQSPALDREITALQDRVNEDVIPLTDELERSVLGDLQSFDGSIESLLPTITLASSSGYANTDSAFYAIPCAILQRQPGLLDATRPTWGGNRDNFMPRSGCQWGRGAVAGYPTALMDAYVDAAYLASGDMFAPENGTIRFAHMAGQSHDLEMAMLKPDELPSAPAGSRKPFEVWSYLSPANWDVFNAIEAARIPAQDALITYWVSLGKSRDMAVKVARDTLFSVVYGADCDTPVPVDAMRVMLIENRPVADIVATAKRGAGQDGNLFARCAAYGGIDPLLHVAVMRSDSGEILDILSQNGYFADIEAHNDFGKTALMAAAQQGNSPAVRWLLDKGADVQALTNATDKWEYPRHGERTALHYAAAAGDAAVVKMLIAAGAKSNAVDDEGFSVRDYLIGREDLPGNTTVSSEDRAMILRLLDGQKG